MSTRTFFCLSASLLDSTIIDKNFTLISLNSGVGAFAIRTSFSFLLSFTLVCTTLSAFGWGTLSLADEAGLDESRTAVSAAATPTPTSHPAENVDLKEVVEAPPVVKAIPPELRLVPEEVLAEEELRPVDVLPVEDVDTVKDTEKESAGRVDVEAQTGSSGADKNLEAESSAAQERHIPALEAEPGILEALAQEMVHNVPEQKSLVLLGAEVAPGTSTRLEWSPSVSFMGISAPSPVLVINGVKAGPTLCLTAAVHGDELNGIEIVRRIMYNIEPQELSGAIIGVPIVNLQGFRRSSRYLPDRRDLNRYFPGNPEGSSASRIAASFFNQIIKRCDLLIDLHTGSFRRTNLPQLRADMTYSEVAKFARKMGAIVVVQSEGTEGSLRRAAVEAGIPSLTLEAGAPHELEREAVEHGVKSIESAMDSLGMLKRRRFWERPSEPVYYQSMWVRAKEGGILFSEIKLGDPVTKGHLLGVVTDPITNMRSEVLAPFDGRVIGMALNQVMYPGFAAYHIGLQSSVEKVAQQNPLVSRDDETIRDEDHAADDAADAPSPLDEESTKAAGPEAPPTVEVEMVPVEDSE